MSSSLRARRMARNHKRMSRPAKLNLVALMDIFTILVLFLIVNNGDVEVLDADKKIALPESVSEQRPQASLIVKITPEELLLQERSVMSVEEALDTKDATLQALVTQLQYQASLLEPLTPEQEKGGRAIVIMGDEGTPYRLLKRIMAACAATDYRDLSLAVNSKPAAVGTMQLGSKSQVAMLGSGQ